MQDDLDTLLARARRARALHDTLAATLSSMLIELELLRLREAAPPAVDEFVERAYMALASRERESHGGLSAEAS
jgi:signal transduction histidine kinase